MTDLKAGDKIPGLDSAPLNGPMYVWVSCRGKRCQITWKALCRIQLAKQQYDLEPKELPYLDIPLAEFHQILTVLRDENRICDESIVDAYFGDKSEKYWPHFNYLLIDAEEIEVVKRKEKEAKEKLRDDLKNNRIVRYEICPKLEKCKDDLCMKAHNAEQFTPARCTMDPRLVEYNCFTCHYCNCKKFNENCRECNTINHSCRCECAKRIHGDDIIDYQSKRVIFDRASQRYRP